VILLNCLCGNLLLRLTRWLSSVGDHPPAHPLVHHSLGLNFAKVTFTSPERHMGSLVHEPALADLSPVGRSFLLAMAQDDGPSHMGDLARRLRVDANYAGQYRLRLLAAEIIQPAGYGSVDFALPYLREYLREHAESLMPMGLQPWTMGPTVGDSEEELPALPPRTEPDP
jgi:hypothetical protein